MITKKEVRELQREFFSIYEKIKELEERQKEIDKAVNNYAIDRVASRYTPINPGDKIRVSIQSDYRHRPWTGTFEGIFGSWELEGHQYWERDRDGMNNVNLLLHQRNKDGSMSKRYEEFCAYNITNIEKVEE